MDRLLFLSVQACQICLSIHWSRIVKPIASQKKLEISHNYFTQVLYFSFLVFGLHAAAVDIDGCLR